MFGFSSSSNNTKATSGNLAADLKPAGDAAAKVKEGSCIDWLGYSAWSQVRQIQLGILIRPCCVCKDEKAARDECMLFSRSDNAQDECKDLVSRYKSCMATYGFQI